MSLDKFSPPPIEIPPTWKSCIITELSGSALEEFDKNLSPDCQFIVNNDDLGVFGQVMKKGENGPYGIFIINIGHLNPEAFKEHLEVFIKDNPQAKVEFQ